MTTATLKEKGVPNTEIARMLEACTAGAGSRRRRRHGPRLIAAWVAGDGGRNLAAPKRDQRVWACVTACSALLRPPSS